MFSWDLTVIVNGQCGSAVFTLTWLGRSKGHCPLAESISLAGERHNVVSHLDKKKTYSGFILYED